MKKFTALFVILIFLSSIPAFAAILLKEGVYKPSDFNYSPNISYTFENVSPDTSAYFAVFDENQVVLQTYKLPPKSAKFDLIPLAPDYRISIVGDGEVSIAENNSKK